MLDLGVATCCNTSRFVVLDESIMQEQFLINKLLSYRLQWYRAQMLEKLIRFKHVIVLLIGLLIAPLNLFNAFFVQPIIHIAYSESADHTIIVSLLLTQVIYLAWIIFQEHAVSHQQVKNYLNSLPISQIKHYATDIAVLFVANNIAWIPIIAALINAPYATMTGLSSVCLFVTKILILIVSILAIQMQWLYKRYFSFVLIAIIDLFFYAGCITTRWWMSVLFITLSLFSSLLLTYPWDVKLTILRKLFASVRISYDTSMLKYSRFQLLKMNYIVLMKKYFIEFLMRGVLSLSILTFGFFVIRYGDAINAEMWSVALLSIVVLTLSGLFSLLKESREQYILYLYSLPISRFSWYMLDYLAIAILIMIFEGLYISALMVFKKINMLEVVEIVLSSGVLALILCYVRNKFRKFNSLFSIIVTAMWVVLISYNG